MNLNLIYLLTENAGIRLSIWDFVIMGGWLMIPIFLLSIVAIYIICERTFAISQSQKNGKNILDRLHRSLDSRDKKQEVGLADSHSPYAYIVKKGVQYKNLPANELKNIMESTANESIAEMEKGFSILAMVASIAPMIGFLGTVIGMVQAFYDMSLAGSNIDISLLSRGIYTAMITTVAGLIVGIIALTGYNMLVAKVNQVANNMDRLIEKFIESLY